MIKAFCKWMLFKAMGWTSDISEPHPDKFIICLAPHTSNMDFFIGLLYSRAVGMKSNFLMKKEWFFWPLGPLFKKLGGIPVWRSKHTSMTDHLATEAMKAKHFQLCITPEGTRSPNPDWKMGFYYIALKAQIPILLYALDYEEKLIQCIHTVIPNGDVEKQMRDIKLYFKDFKGRHPEKFTIGNID